MKLVRRNVRVSQVSEAQVEALEGLSVGDVIVHEAIARLSEGLEVEPSAASAPPEGPRGSRRRGSRERDGRLTA